MPHLAIYLDCETTGLDPEKHAIIEFTAAILNPNAGFAEVDRYRSGQVAMPQGSAVSPEALAINGYGPTTLHLGRSPADVAGDFANFLDRYQKEPFTLIGHNVSFDEGFMRKFAETNGYNYASWFSHRKVDVCAFLNARNLINGSKGSSLKDACAEWGVVNEKAHTSDSDVTAGIEVMKKIFGTVNFANMVPPMDGVEKEKAEIPTGLPTKKKK